MMLFSYLQRTQLLLNDPEMATYNRFDLTTWINVARSQIAVESAAVRSVASLSLSSGTNNYGFSAIALSASGVSGVLAVRMASYGLTGGGQQFITPRTWEWFNRFLLCQAGSFTGPPQQWAQYGQGSLGSLYVYPTPGASYTLSLDTSCYPSNLAADTDPEALPYPWQDAVPYYAAYQALLTRQKMDDADAMFKTYEKFAARARRFSTPEVLPLQYSQRGMGADA